MTILDEQVWWEAVLKKDAGMDGALASVIGGLVSVPVIGLPTSVGYGSARGGETALRAMLCSCAAGLAVVDIDDEIPGPVVRLTHTAASSSPCHDRRLPTPRIGTATTTTLRVPTMLGNVAPMPARTF